jgi:GDP-L-fucose synthase
MEFNGTIFYNQKLDGQLRKPSDNSKLKQLIGSFTFTPIEEGLEESIGWFVENYERARK